MLITTASGIKDLELIRALQEKNLRSRLNDDESQAEGFLSAEYTLDFLKVMHDASPSIVAKDGDNLAGYALVTTRDVARQHPLLDDLVSTIDKTMYKGELLRQAAYILVGQLCVAKEYRGQNIVGKLYNKFRQQMEVQYQYCITDVASSNPRSLKAHIKAGFQVIDQLSYSGISWNIVLWDWTGPSLSRGN